MDLSNNQLSGIIPDEICNQGDLTPNLDNNQLCQQYFGTDNEAYPSCISNLDNQDTSGCELYIEEEHINPGDVYADGIINIQDIVKMINCILGYDECTPQADMNDDGAVNIQDIITLVNCILSGDCIE